MPNAGIHNFLMLEYKLGDVPWWNQIVDPQLLLIDGYLLTPSTPGLTGYRVDRD